MNRRELCTPEGEDGVPIGTRRLAPAPVREDFSWLMESMVHLPRKPSFPNGGRTVAHPPESMATLCESISVCLFGHSQTGTSREHPPNKRAKPGAGPVGPVQISGEIRACCMAFDRVS